MGNREQGFSLIELLIVVAIILIIAAIAIPDLLRSRMAANESAAVGNLRTAGNCAVTFQVTISTVDAFPGANVSDWANCVDPGLATAIGTGGIKQGFTYSYTPAGTPPRFYTLKAVPVTPGSTGSRAFCLDQSGVIKVATCTTTCPDPCASTTTL